ncbi:hypothetical protein M9R32_03745 [Paenisporosarcina quisquiliarum]|uniref:Uncharacterized protein n=1 Tax=Paenisporosarcina quisquiliarum TaxID=365346 RepID=A0A9X3RC31_9BACL|nr:hypothetical protein [Paenisporosarcina quisquiliarum]MCZ8536310.1 hypothetical protein [Paenisporosarcina quisquiliarum]
MDKIAQIIIFYVDGWIALCFYFYIRKFKKLIGFQLGMNISVAMGGMAALLTGVLLLQQYPFHFTLITLISTTVGLMVGALFGLLFDYQTFVTGLTNGAFIGLMSPMIGTVVEMPTLFNWFLHGVFALCLLTIVISIKRS